MKNRKELLASYKEQKPEMGVFEIVHVVSGKRWIDSSTHIQARWNRHQSELRFGSHRNRDLQETWTKSGPEGFRFAVLEALEYAKEGTGAVDYAKELKLLQAMVIEGLHGSSDYQLLS